VTTVYLIFCICSAGDAALPLLEVNFIKFSKQPAMEKFTHFAGIGWSPFIIIFL
jgi:hypothetical protein